jgi:hypothetical protein
MDIPTGLQALSDTVEQSVHIPCHQQAQVTVVTVILVIITRNFPSPPIPSTHLHVATSRGALCVFPIQETRLFPDSAVLNFRCIQNVLLSFHFQVKISTSFFMSALFVSLVYR